MAHTDVYVGNQKLAHISEVAKIADDPAGLVIWAKNNTKEYCDRVMLDSQNKGKEMHGLFEDIIRGKQQTPPKTRADYFRAFNHFCIARRLVPSPKYLEYAVMDKVAGYAGHLDNFDEVNNIMLDWKVTSGIRTSNLVQAAGYAQALKVQNGIETKTLLIARFFDQEKPTFVNEVKKLKHTTRYSFEGCSVGVEVKETDKVAAIITVFNHCLSIYNYRKGI